MSLVNMKEMLQDASRLHYAVGMFDVSDLEMIRAVAEEADALLSKIAGEGDVFTFMRLTFLSGRMW